MALKNFDGAVAVITGGAGGIGLATAVARSSLIVPYQPGASAKLHASASSSLRVINPRRYKRATTFSCTSWGYCLSWVCSYRSVVMTSERCQGEAGFELSCQ